MARIILFLCAFNFYASLAHAKEKVLSLSDTRYQLLESIQSRYCGGNVTHPCQLPVEFCIESTSKVREKLFKGDKKLKELMKEACSIRGTKYEMPGMHWLLENRLDRVDNIAHNRNEFLSPRPIIGAVPTRDINASAIPFSVPIILLNMQFMEFANEFSKLAAFSIPFSIDRGHYAIDVSETANISHIQSNEKLRKSFIALLQYFIFSDKKPYTPPSEFSQTVQVVYTEGIEEFAVAHEYGHLYLNHPDSAAEDPMYVTPKSEKRIEDQTKVSPPLVIRELEADSYALRTMTKIQNEYNSKSDVNPFFKEIISSIEFYFIARQVLDEAANQYGTSQLELSEQEIKDARSVAECVAREGCLVRELKELRSLSSVSAMHPSHLFRLEVVKQYKSLSGLNNSDEFSIVARLVNRNATLLWRSVKTDFHAKPQKR